MDAWRVLEEGAAYLIPGSCCGICISALLPGVSDSRLFLCGGWQGLWNFVFILLSTLVASLWWKALGTVPKGRGRRLSVRQMARGALWRPCLRNAQPSQVGSLELRLQSFGRGLVDIDSAKAAQNHHKCHDGTESPSRKRRFRASSKMFICLWHDSCVLLSNDSA